MIGKTIVFQAAPFCYGPISTTLNIARALGSSGHSILILDEGPTGELIRRSGLPVDCVRATSSLPLSPELVRLIDQADLVVSNTDPLFAAACIERGASVAVVDTLFWMWDRLPPALYDAALFICQDFPGLEAQLRRIGRPERLHVVGPMTNPQTEPLSLQERENLIHVSLGGCDCALVDVTTDRYPQTILGLIEEAADIALPPEFRIVFCCGKRARAALRPRAGRLTVATLGNAEHVAVIRKAAASCLSPGITGVFEVLEAETPVFLLPSQNYSQVLQLQAFREAAISPDSLGWSDLFLDFQLPRYEHEEQAVARTREAVDRFVTDEGAQRLLRDQLVAFYRYGRQRFDSTPGRLLRSALGGNGTGRAATLLLEWFEQR